MNSLFFVLIYTVFLFLSNADRSEIDVCVTQEEMKLYNMINEYRKQHKLPPIPLSASLCLVAKQHVKDLTENKPDTGICNMHSWSNKGKWTSCCYTSDHSKAECMWNKPKEIAGFGGNGYEIAHGGDETYQATAISSLEGWKKSKNHNNVILNKEKWSAITWKAIGVAIKDNYAVVWFSDGTDTKPTPKLCN